MVGVSYLFVRWSQETTQRSKEGRQEGKTLTRRVYYLVQSELSCTRKTSKCVSTVHQLLAERQSWGGLVKSPAFQVGVCGQRKSHTANNRDLGLSLTWFAMLGNCGLIPFLFNFLLWLIQLCVWPHAHMNVHIPQHRCGEHTTAEVWRSEGSLRELLLFFQQVGLGNLTWVIRLGSKRFALWASSAV